jgi:hypothetical protein
MILSLSTPYDDIATGQCDSWPTRGIRHSRLGHGTLKYRRQPSVLLGFCNLEECNQPRTRILRCVCYGLSAAIDVPDQLFPRPWRFGETQGQLAFTGTPWNSVDI